MAEQLTTLEGLATLDEAAQFFGCTVAGVRRWIGQGRLPKVKLGRLTRIRRSDLMKIAATGLPPARK